MTEEELVKEGKRLLATGTPRMALYKYMKEQIPFNNQKRIRILQQIMPDGNDNNLQQQAKSKSTTKTPEELKLNRELIKAKYVVKDFEEGISKVGASGILLILVGMIYLASTFIFGAFSFSTAMFCIIAGVILIVAKKLINWNEIEQIYTIISLAVFMFLIEFIVLGLPDALIPRFVEGFTTGGTVLVLLNALTPFAYLVLKPALIFYPLILMLIYKNKKEKIPQHIKEQLST